MMKEIEAVEWLKESYGGSWEIFVDPVALYNDFERLRKEILELGAMVEKQRKNIVWLQYQPLSQEEANKLLQVMAKRNRLEKECKELEKRLKGPTLAECVRLAFRALVRSYRGCPRNGRNGKEMEC